MDYIVDLAGATIKRIDDVNEYIGRLYSPESGRKPKYYLKLLKHIFNIERRKAKGIHTFGMLLNNMEKNILRNRVINSLDIDIPCDLVRICAL